MQQPWMLSLGGLPLEAQSLAAFLLKNQKMNITSTYSLASLRRKDCSTIVGRK
jgi:hypothetical protein